MGHRLAGEQGADDVGALPQAGVALGPFRPGEPGDVLVQPLATAEGQP